MGKRFNYKLPESIPGPGRYDPKSKSLNKKGKVAFGSTLEKETLINDVKFLYLA